MYTRANEWLWQKVAKAIRRIAKNPGGLEAFGNQFHVGSRCNAIEDVSGARWAGRAHVVNHNVPQKIEHSVWGVVNF